MSALKGLILIRYYKVMIKRLLDLVLSECNHVNQCHFLQSNLRRCHILSTLGSSLDAVITLDSLILNPFQSEILINVLVSSFSFIEYLCVYGHFKYFTLSVRG